MHEIHSIVIHCCALNWSFEFCFFLEFLVPTLSVASAIVTLVAFFKDRTKHNYLLLASSLVVASMVIWVWDSNKQKAYDMELLKQKQQFEATIYSEKERYISEDAEIVAESINLYGEQTYGKYLAQLGTIVGFYQRHKQKYESQFEKLSKQYDNWDEFFRRKRESGETIYSSDFSALEGIVKSNLDLIKNIGKRAETHNRSTNTDT